MSEQYLCIEVKEFPLQALLRLWPELQGKPVVVLEGDSPQEQVCSLNRQAAALGIAKGMTLVEMEMFPTVLLLPRSLAGEAATRDALLEFAGCFSPRVADRSSDGYFTGVIDIAGTETLFGSPNELAESLLNKTKELCLRASITVCSNVRAAMCLARGRSAGIRVIPAGMQAEALALLSLKVLDITPELADTFFQWGIATLGELAKLSETALITRLGQVGKTLRLLARGEAPDLLIPVEADFTLEEHMDLDSPVELLDSLLFIAGVMLDQLIQRAQSHILALASMTLHLGLEEGAPHMRTVRPALPNNDRQLWLKLMHLDLLAHPPTAAIKSLTLSAQPGSTSKVQLGLFSPQVPEAMRLDVTLARILSIVGEDNVGQAVLKDTHRPDAFRVEPFVVPASAASNRPPGTQRVALRQLRPAELVSVTVCEQQPYSFVFRDKRYTVERAYGPWSSGGDWWKPTLWSVEQWDLVARGEEGRAAWLCCCLSRDLTQDRWLLEALYD